MLRPALRELGFITVSTALIFASAPACRTRRGVAVPVAPTKPVASPAPDPSLGVEVVPKTPKVPNPVVHTPETKPEAPKPDPKPLEPEPKPEPKPEPGIPDGLYTLINVNSGKCMDIPRSGTDNFLEPWQWGCNNTTAQQFRIVREGNGGYKLINVNSSKALQIRARAVENGAFFEQYDSNADVGQQFAFDRSASGIYSIRSLLSHKLISVSNASTDNEARLMQWESLGADGKHQLWQIFPKDSNVALP